MHTAIIFRILGLLLMVFSIALLPPILVSLIYQDSALQAFITTLGITFAVGAALWLPVRHRRQELRTRDGFVVTVMFWLVLAVSGSLPLMLADNLGLSFTDAFFESMSGWTTTGATVLTGLDNLPPSILFYRQFLQWLGGMGIIVLAVAILPMLGIGGMQLYRTETPGPMKDSKLTPRITETAKALWYIYLTLTICCSLGFWLAGMSLFDAICHAFSTVAIGGFSTHDASIGYFNSGAVETVAIFFMVISAFNFALHFYAWRYRSIKHYFADAEVRTLLMMLAIVAVLTVLTLVINQVYEPMDALRFGLFELVSIATTTGFATADFSQWPVFLPFMLFFLAFMGGCAGSTGGGLKVIRVLLIFKQGSRELKRLIHPNAIIPIRVGGRPVGDRIVEAIWGFCSVYLMLYLLMCILLLTTGLDMVSAFTAVGACMNNLGPGLGSVAAHYGEISDFAKWVLSFAMILGRLEIFTLLVLFTPTFWRQ
ncbi:MAG: TrkH family potassium uptake protein [Bermanella sp.]